MTKEFVHACPCCGETVDLVVICETQGICTVCGHQWIVTEIEQEGRPS
jgi:rRNA maturation endonuclease Nob1